MNDLINAIILAIVQGITEWIPVSSSGHLVIFQEILNYPVGMEFDVALHFGTLMAVFVYFGKDIVDIIEAMLKRQFRSENGKLGILLILATIPAAFIGYLFNDVFSSSFDSLFLTGIGFSITSLLLFIASLDLGKKTKNIPSYKDSITIGIAQVFALFPGISRAGSTLSVGLMSGLNEKSALKFSFLMSIPIIFGASIFEMNKTNLPSELIWAALVSFFIGLIVMHLLYNFVLTDKKNLRWFAIYALILAIGIILSQILNS